MVRIAAAREREGERARDCVDDDAMRRREDGDCRRGAGLGAGRAEGSGQSGEGAKREGVKEERGRGGGAEKAIFRRWVGIVVVAGVGGCRTVVGVEKGGRVMVVMVVAGWGLI